MAAIFDDLSIIYKNNENTDCYQYLVQANDTCEWIGMICIKYVFGIVLSVCAMCSISILYSWHSMGHLNVDHFYHPLPLIFPWNQSTLLGYIAEIFSANLGGFAYLTVAGTFLVLFISMSVHHQAFWKMFEHKIDELNRSKEKRCDDDFLRDLMHFHTTAKDWFSTTAEIFSPIVTLQLICSVIMLAVSIFFLDLQAHQFEYSMITAMITLSITLSIGLINAFIYCYFGSLATESYDKMADHIWQLNWFELPIKQQKYFILMAANMQRQIHYHGFGVFDLNLERFCRLIKAVFSYYMSFKTLTANR